MNSLGELYRTQRQYKKAEPFYQRALAIQEKALGTGHPDVARSLNNLGELYRAEGQYEKSEQNLRRSLIIREKILGLDHPDIATVLNSLAWSHLEQGDYIKAESFCTRSLTIREKVLGQNHPDVADSLNTLAATYYSLGEYEKAEPLYKRSLAIYNKAIVSDWLFVATILNNLQSLYFKREQYTQALSSMRQASAIYRQRIISAGTGDSAVWEASKNRTSFFRHLLLLSRNPNQEPAIKLTDESFQIVQLEQTSGTAAAVAKMASRFASSDDALAGLIKRQQDARIRRAKKETQLVTESSKPPQERKFSDEERVRVDIAHTLKEIETIDAELSRLFPEYQELTRSEPVSVDQIRTLLKPGEAMLVYALGENSFLWAVTPDDAKFIQLQTTVNDIAAKVALVRSWMEFDNFGMPRPVNVDSLHSLYQSIFAPAMPYLSGIRHVMVVPAGPLQSLPFGVLVATSPPVISSDADYSQIDWLAKHYAFSVLPSVSALRSLRQFNKTVQPQEPFAGFGDPLIGEVRSTTRGKRAGIDIATLFRNPTVNAKVPTRYLAPEIADVDAIRQTPRLPETAHELQAMAKTLKASPDAIWLQESANETHIKGLDLSKYRTIAFATHGMMAGEIDGIGEPGLILTPPKYGTIEDDGYLSAGEIARLKLNADWVILSACNTAAADGTPSAEGLSGLAKAFFYAGARSLLVSNWYVDSETAMSITTETLKHYVDNPAIGKAEALRQAMQVLHEDPLFAHPLFWAPFVVVGEGGVAVR